MNIYATSACILLKIPKITKPYNKRNFALYFALARNAALGQRSRVAIFAGKTPVKGCFALARDARKPLTPDGTPPNAPTTLLAIIATAPHPFAPQRLFATSEIHTTNEIYTTSEISFVGSYLQQTKFVAITKTKTIPTSEISLVVSKSINKRNFSCE